MALLKLIVLGEEVVMNVIQFCRNFSAAVLVTAAGATVASAATVNIDRIESNAVVSENGIRDNTATLGSDLPGMLVTATFDDGSSETMVWEQILNARGGVSTTGFSLLFAGRDFDLNTSRIVSSLLLQAGLGNAVWDTIYGQSVDDPENTVGTTGGYPFEVKGGDPVDGEINVTYSGVFEVAGNPRGSDAFTDMFVDFTSLVGGGVTGLFSFNSDLDSLEVAGDLTPIEVSTVPLPAGMPLLLAGMALLGLQRRRRG